MASVVRCGSRRRHFYFTKKGKINMAINEITKTGRVFRKLIDKENMRWLKLSFWTASTDVEFADGKTAEKKLGAINGISSDPDDESEDIAASIKVVNQIKKAFGDGVNKIYNKLVGLGFTPDSNSPDGVSAAIDKVYNDRYEKGKQDFKPVILRGTIVDPDSKGYNVKGSVYIPTGLDYVCAGITSTYHCTSYLPWENYNSMYNVTCGWTYNKATGEVCFELGLGNQRYLGHTDASISYMIMYVPKE